MFWKKYKRTYQAWYHHPAWKNEITEETRQKLDELRAQGRENHPAQHYDDMSDEVQTMLAGLDIEILDLKQSETLHRLVLVCGLIIAYAAGYLKTPDQSPWIVWTIVAVLCVVSVILYKRHSKKIFKSHMANDSEGLNKQMLRDWEVKYISNAKKGNGA